MEIVSISSGFFGSAFSSYKLPYLFALAHTRTHTGTPWCTIRILLHRWHNCCHIRPLNGAFLGGCEWVRGAGLLTPEGKRDGGIPLPVAALFPPFPPLLCEACQ